MFQTKEFHAAVKAAGKDDGLGDGQVRMLVSAFGNVDSYGDVVMPGAFTDTLKDWKSKGDPIPFIWAHQWSDPFSHIGTIDPSQAKETDDGLEVLAQLDLTMATAKQVFGLLKGRRVTQASFGYTIDDAEGVEREAEDGAKYYVYELRKLSLIECGPCLVGANQETELLEAKSAALRGRVLPVAEVPRLKRIRDSIDANIAVAEAAATQQTSGAPAPGTAETSAGKTASTGQLNDREADGTPAPQGEAPSAQSPSSKSAQARARLSLALATERNEA